MQMKLNIGCGSVHPNGWMNVDYSLGARFTRIPFYDFINRRMKLFDLDPDGNPRQWDGVRIHNLQKRFPWADESVDVVYASHILEHFSKEEGLLLLKECRRVLKKGGIIRIVVPDLKVLVDRYRDGVLRADDFVESLGVLYLSRNSAIKDFLSVFMQYPHKCMYDTPTLLAVLDSHGFEAKSKDPFESSIEGIRDIELEGRTEDAVIVEGTKK